MTDNAKLSAADAMSLGASRSPSDRAFLIALCGATLLHASFLLSLLGAPPRGIGSPDGSREAINVTTISESEFRDQFALDRAGQGPTPPAPPPTQVQEAQPPQPQPEPEQPAETEAPAEPPTQESAEKPVEQTQPEKEIVEVAAEEKTEAEVEAEPKDVPDVRQLKADKAPEKRAPEAAPAEASETLQDIEEAIPGLLAVPDPAAEAAARAKQQAAQKKKQKSAKPQRQAKLDFSTPAARFDAPPGGGTGSAAFQRPPGITRSGLNDEFARRVIMALQQTMPQLSNTKGRVTVRIFLNENGNIESVSIVRPSQVSGLDQSVVFATKQTSYPIPPAGSNTADRTFIVTYIYELY